MEAVPNSDLPADGSGSRIDNPCNQSQGSEARLKYLKSSLKLWEDKFQRKYGHIPSKEDIKRYPDALKRYKEYSKLKKDLSQSSKQSTDTSGPQFHSSRDIPAFSLSRTPSKKDRRQRTSTTPTGSARSSGRRDLMNSLSASKRRTASPLNTPTPPSRRRNFLPTKSPLRHLTPTQLLHHPNDTTLFPGIPEEEDDAVNENEPPEIVGKQLFTKSKAFHQSPKRPYGSPVRVREMPKLFGTGLRIPKPGENIAVAEELAPPMQGVFSVVHNKRKQKDADAEQDNDSQEIDDGPDRLTKTELRKMIPMRIRSSFAKRNRFEGKLGALLASSKNHDQPIQPNLKPATNIADAETVETPQPEEETLTSKPSQANATQNEESESTFCKVAPHDEVIAPGSFLLKTATSTMRRTSSFTMSLSSFMRDEDRDLLNVDDDDDYQKSEPATNEEAGREQTRDPAWEEKGFHDLKKGSTNTRSGCRKSAAKATKDRKSVGKSVAKDGDSRIRAIETTGDGGSKQRQLAVTALEDREIGETYGEGGVESDHDHHTSSSSDCDDHKIAKKKTRKRKAVASKEPKTQAKRKKANVDLVQEMASNPSKGPTWSKEGAKEKKFDGVGSNNFRALKLSKSNFSKAGRGRFSRGSKGLGRFGRGYNSSAVNVSGDNWDDEYQAKMDDLELMDSIIQKEPDQALQYPLQDIFAWNEEDEDFFCTVSSKFWEGVSCEDIRVNMLAALRNLTGLNSFLPGQLEAVKRILNKDSTLLMMATGGGKSLCYQICAYVLRQLAKTLSLSCLVLVVSPMLSLIQDQIRCLPSRLVGLSLSNLASTKAYSAALEQLSKDAVDVLFVSPEKIQTKGFKDLVHNGEISPIKLMCIDEVHCLSEWSHNFRTSYLALPITMNNLLGNPCVLGLTGSATVQTRAALCQMLSLPAGAVIARELVRNNLRLSVTRVYTGDNREELLVSLLQSPTMKQLSGIIIYTMFQNQADSVASYLKLRNFHAESYHAGKSSVERALIQNRFMTGTVPIVVATVAFGLGINKKDVRSVIHFSIPKSLENYVQEIGRSGRDGEDSYCHMFLHREDYIKHRSFAFGESVDESQVWRFLLRVFTQSYPPMPSFEELATSKSSTSNVAVKSIAEGTSVGWIGNRLTMLMSIVDAQNAFDIRENVLSTILHYIQSFENDCISILPTTTGQHAVSLTAKGLQNKEDRVIAAILLCGQKQRSRLIFNTLDVCAELNMNPNSFSLELGRLQRKKELSYEALGLSFHLEIHKLWDADSPEDMEDKSRFLDKLREYVVEKMCALEKAKVGKLDHMYNMLQQASVEKLEDVSFLYPQNVVDDAVDENIATELDRSHVSMEKEATLKCAIDNYFQSADGIPDPSSDPLVERWGFTDEYLVRNSEICKNDLVLDLNFFITKHKDCITSGRAVARIFHGIGSPMFPTEAWNRNEHWGTYTHVNFVEICRLATRELCKVRKI